MTETARKVYVPVTVRYSSEGEIRPLSITWEDDTEYEITRIKEVRRAASTKAGGVGMRYTCVIDNKETHLFYEDNNRWFVEAKTYH